jgi:hypothetical protein
MSPDLIDLNFFDTWVQIHKLPIGYRKDSIVKHLLENKGVKVWKVELDSMGMGNFVRARVKLDVRNVLARFVSISRGGEREFYQLQYEKIPKFCGACGFFGHSHLECGSGEHNEANLKWGEFLRADWETWHGRGTNFARGTGRGSGRSGRSGDLPFGGRGRDLRGRGDPMIPWRHNANLPGMSSEDPDLRDTATSPGKIKDMDLDKDNLKNTLAKRSLILMEDADLEATVGVHQETQNLEVPMVTDRKTPANL